jgi:foldase protein PrsA
MQPNRLAPSFSPLPITSSLVVMLSFIVGVGLTGCSFSRSPPRNSATMGAAGLVAAQRLEVEDEALFRGPDEVIASVNGRDITRREFIARAVRQLGTMTLLSEVIKEELFLQEAERVGIKVTDEDVEKEVDAIFAGMSREMGQGNADRGREKLADLYEKQGLKLEDVRRDLRRRSRNQLVIARVTKGMRNVDDATLREYYEQNRRFFTRHIAYRFPSLSELPTSKQVEMKRLARERASRAVELVRSGKAMFEALAQAESDDEATRSFGGNLGPVTVTAPMPPELKKAIFSLGEGEVSEPVENPRGGYHVFQVTRIQPEGSFESVVDQLRTEFVDREPDLREIREAFYRLREKARIRWPSAER